MISGIYKWKSVFATFLALGVNAPTAKAQLGAPSTEIAEAVQVDHAPKLDGTLDDPLWQIAKPIRDFRQQEPYEGQTATEPTEVRILYTRHAVYFGIHCLDSDPGRIIASELRRDASQDLDDHFEIMIDSNYDRRGGYVFQVNPLGTQMDGLI
ncbi:MAG TPA: carbohydrate binding family 9 domain-containing protein, partial [Candidatus Eremiobacteraceae bacterium]|nr:carbohydrate binding family 9 domain-containing protein [Candidatus Eremiobacteraceae bacterium]